MWCMETIDEIMKLWEKASKGEKIEKIEPLK